MVDVILSVLVGLGGLALFYFVALVAGFGRCDESDCLAYVPPWRAYCRTHNSDAGHG